MFRLFDQGYKVTVVRVGQVRGKLHSCWVHKWMAEQEAQSIIRTDPMVTAVRVYSRNRAEYRYGVAICLRLERDLDGYIETTGGTHAMVAEWLAERQVAQAVLESK